MNFGLAAVAILLALSPGVFFREAYFSGSFSKRFIPSRTLQEFASILLLGVAIHFVFLFLVPRYNTLPLRSLFDFWVGDCFSDLGAFCRDNCYWFINYFIFVNIWSAWMGMTVQKVFRYFKLDRKTLVLRFQNSWYYILSGEIMDFPSNKTNKFHLSKVIDTTVIDVLTNVCGKPVIYTGLLFEYFLANDGKLDSIVLMDVNRMTMEKYDEVKMKDPQHEIPVPGKFLTLTAKEILNVNVNHFKNEKIKYRAARRFVRYVRIPLLSWIVLYAMWEWHPFMLRVLEGAIRWF